MTKWKVIDKREQADTLDAPKKTVKKKLSPKFWTVLAVVVVCVAVLIWALPHLPLKPQGVQPSYYKGVVELWNVEAFEGGVGSREHWLIEKSAKFESTHTGLFVHVTTLTVEQLETKLAGGETFDMICFSRGVGVLVQEMLAPFTESVGFVKENYLVSGQINGNQYAVPLYSGAYCLFARTEQLAEDQLVRCALSQTYTRKIGKNTVELKPLVCGFTDYNSPLSALALSGGRGVANVDETVTQYQAYEQFVANKTAVTLLGTQRDMYRLGQKESLSKIEQLGFAPLAGYTDLVQYLGISSSAGDKADSCVQYVQFLLAEQTQATLVDLCLFSVLQTTFYTTPRFADCEKGLTSAYVPNAFGGSDSVVSQRQTALTTLQADDGRGI